MKTPRAATIAVDSTTTKSTGEALLPTALGLPVQDSVLLSGGQILFVDANVEEVSSLLSSLAAGVEVVYLDDETAVLDQIASALVGRSALSAIHLVSHGSAGQLAFASGAVSSDNLASYTAQLSAIGSALADEGDLLLYGCDVAQGEAGKAFIATLSSLTGADVAASVDITGKDGNWVLESHVGQIETPLALSSSSYGYDLAAPTVTITSTRSAVGIGGTAPITMTFSAAPTNFSVKKLLSDNGTFSDFAVSASDTKVYTATFTPTPGTKATTSGISIAAGSYTDAAKVKGLAGALSNLAIDMIAPTVTLSSNVATLKAGQTATITATFSEAVTGFDAADLLSANGTFTNFARSNTDAKIYTATFTPTPNSTATSAGITIASGSYTDAAGNSGTAGAKPTLAMNVVAPTVAITDDKVGTAGSVVNYTFNLSEASSDFTLDDITIAGGKAGVLTKVSPSVYTLPITPNANSTTSMTVDVAAGKFVNAAGNSNVAATQNVQAVDTMLPTVTLTSSVASVGMGAKATITATFTKDPIGFEIKDLLSDNGSFSDFVVDGSNPRIYTASFTPTPGTKATDAGITVGAGSYKDAAGNMGLAGAKPALAIDMIAPTVTLSSNVSTLKAGQTATITATFSEAVTGFAIGNFSSANGNFSNFTPSNTDAKVYTALFTPTPNSPASDAGITITSGSYTDVAGNTGTAGAKPA